MDIVVGIYYYPLTSLENLVLMQISPTRAIELGLITDREGQPLSKSDYLGKSSIDLTVREVIHKDKKDKPCIVSEHEILPQETVYLLSEQRVDVKVGYVAYVFLKNRMSQSGLLALNTGIVDSGFNGPLSTLITNLSKKSVDIDSDDEIPFFRIVFHEISIDESEKEGFSCNRYDYETYKKGKVKEIKNLPRYFLDPESLKKSIDAELSAKAIDFGFKKLSFVFAIAALLFAFVPPLGKVVGDMIFESEKNSQAKIAKLENELKLIKIELKHLQNQRKQFKKTP